jgi:hypothetical protein
MSDEANNVMKNLDDENVQLSQQSVSSVDDEQQDAANQAERAEEEGAGAQRAQEPPELPEAQAERQRAPQLQEEKEYSVARFKDWCNDKQVGIRARKVGKFQVCKIKADKNGFNEYSNDMLDIFWDDTLAKHGVIVTNRNACRNYAAAQGEGCTRGDKCRFYHFAPGDLVDNFIGREPHKIGDIPVMLAGNAKAREYRWSETDLEKIDAKEEEMLQTFVAAAKQMKGRKRKKTFQQKMEEAIAEAGAEESDSTGEVEESQSESSTPPREKKRRKKSRKPSRKAKDGKKASKAKK